MRKFQEGERVIYVGNKAGKADTPSLVGLAGKVILSRDEEGGVDVQFDGRESPTPYLLPINLEPAPQEAGPVRTVTKLEIVSGEYGRVRVLTLAGVSDKRVGIRITSSDIALGVLDASELRAAASVFISLAEALESQS